jgi:hypothetical protein
VASLNDLVAPAGVPLHFEITSASVFNVFFVPRLGSEIYSMYGMTTELYLQADHPGIYPGLSAHFSGDGFSDMAFDRCKWVSRLEAEMCGHEMLMSTPSGFTAAGLPTGLQIIGRRHRDLDTLKIGARIERLAT